MVTAGAHGPMGINPISLAWLAELQAEHGIFDGAAVAELGPQDIRAPEALLRELLRLDDAARLPTVGEDVYRILGAGSYCAIDRFDDRAAVAMDLNQPYEGAAAFDVVTNFGTAEHVFNIGEVFRTVHRLTKPGGVMLHSLPALGHIDHGFWNIHPKAYISLAHFNGYELLGFWYVPDAFFTGFDIVRGRAKLDVEPFRVAGTDAFGTHEFSRTAGMRFIRNAIERVNAGYFRNPSFGMVDYCQVALRKVHDRAFAYPFERHREPG